MDEPFNCEQVTTTSDQQPKSKETAQGVLENSDARAEIVVPSSATWSEGVSACEGSWVGY